MSILQYSENDNLATRVESYEENGDQMGWERHTLLRLRSYKRFVDESENSIKIRIVQQKNFKQRPAVR